MKNPIYKNNEYRIIQLASDDAIVETLDGNIVDDDSVCAKVYMLAFLAACTVIKHRVK